MLITKQLSFEDVQIAPRINDIQSRNDVDLEIDGEIPIIAANMDGVGTISMARELAKFKMLTALHKFYPLETLIDFFTNDTASRYCYYSMGTSEEDIKKFLDFRKECTVRKICIDVANGYSHSFLRAVHKIKDLEPQAHILAGNVACVGGAVAALAHGASVVKVGIAQGCFVAGTKVKTINGHKNIEDINIGELVLTHDGTYCSVTNILKREEFDDLICINNVVCTKNHKFYVVHKNDIEKINEENINTYAEWVCAEHLSDDYLLIECLD